MALAEKRTSSGDPPPPTAGVFVSHPCFAAVSAAAEEMDTAAVSSMLLVE